MATGGGPGSSRRLDTRRATTVAVAGTLLASATWVGFLLVSAQRLSFARQLPLAIALLLAALLGAVAAAVGRARAAYLRSATDLGAALRSVARVALAIACVLLATGFGMLIVPEALGAIFFIALGLPLLAGVLPLAVAAATLAMTFRPERLREPGEPTYLAAWGVALLAGLVPLWWGWHRFLLGLAEFSASPP